MDSQNSICSNCGFSFNQPQPTPITVLPEPKINTHTWGLTIMAFLISMLWFTFNGKPVFPLGLIGGLIIIAFSRHIDMQVGKQSIAVLGVILSIIGMIIGAVINFT
jgi:hypothetical protein